MNEHKGQAEIIRTHKDTWASVRMGDFMFLLCVGAAGASSRDPDVCVVNMETGKIVHNHGEIIEMVRETSDISKEDAGDNEVMFDYTRNEYI